MMEDGAMVFFCMLGGLIFVGIIIALGVLL